jgi:4-hydroxybenzoate polyprenyltransferase
MGPLRYGCLYLIVTIVRYMFWVILISCFWLLLNEIIKSVDEYEALKRRLKR